MSDKPIKPTDGDDLALYDALHCRSGATRLYQDLCLGVPSDEEILRAVGTVFGISGGSSRNDGGFSAYAGGRNPRFWSQEGTGKCLQGKALAAAVRRVLGLPGTKQSEPIPQPRRSAQRSSVMSKVKSEKKGAAAAPPAEAVDDQLRRLHSIEALGKQIVAIDKKLATAHKAEDAAKADVRKTKGTISALVDEREDLIAEQTAISMGQFSERLNFPPAPEIDPIDTAGLRDRIKAIGNKLADFPASHEPDFASMSPMEKRLGPKKCDELEKELDKLLRQLSSAVRGEYEQVLCVPGSEKKHPLATIDVLQFSDRKWASQWTLDAAGVNTFDGLRIVPDGPWELQSDLDEAKQHPNDITLRREIFNDRDAAIAEAIAQMRFRVRTDFKKPPADVLDELLKIESALRDLEGTLPIDLHGDPLLLKSGETPPPATKGKRKKKAQADESDDAFEAGAAQFS